jgi:hypothetical protein
MFHLPDAVAEFVVDSRHFMVTQGDEYFFLKFNTGTDRFKCDRLFIQ